MAAPLTLGQIASRLGGRVAGDAGVVVRQVGSIENAQAHQITFFSSARYKSRLAATRAGAVIVGKDGEDLTSLPRIVCDEPYAYFARVSQLFNPLTTQPAGIHPSASVASTARLGERVSIGAGCVVGEEAIIGDDCCLYPNVVLYPRCALGARVIVHSGAVIGADGFGIARAAEGWVKIPQIGRVRIGDDVEIGANSCVDRGALADTVIEDGVKIDNLVQVGHNCRIGRHTVISGCTGLAGSAIVGAHCMIGGAAMIIGHITIADHVHVSAGTFVSRSIHKPGLYTGIFPMDDNANWEKNAATLRQLYTLRERIKALEKKL
jgi:UDP-3-O-[3-hydroxymyristoyl] glucosamine N-acyltransferase